MHTDCSLEEWQLGEKCLQRLLLASCGHFPLVSPNKCSKRSAGEKLWKHFVVL